MKHGMEFLIFQDSTTTTDSSATTDKPSNPIKWSYHGNTGPEYWSSTYPLCIGERQSPIDFNIPAMEEKWMEPFWLKNYDTVPTTITMSNNGHSVVIMVEMPGDLPQFTGGGLNGTYYFRQAHIHWGITSDSGSEHMMSTKSEEAELHLVHYKGDYGSIAAALEHGDGLAVLGVMIHLGYEEHPVFKYITPQLKHIIEPKMSINLTTPFPLRQLLPDDLSMFYRYKGSLTTPPCLERVMWTVFKDMIITSSETMEAFRKLKDVNMLPLSGNFRNIQNETTVHETCIGKVKTN
ncbi:carbonic anhydrase 2-like [Portunus trituberculatus]|uniref:carbonic anhydrase 2-like n=1 Tax=Portunus trituberculatus TaxID=210409 RepID=UPI001E1CE360|nr:carbonic anhydrase 2-like [Portunus trituberculatus]